MYVHVRICMHIHPALSIRNAQGSPRLSFSYTALGLARVSGKFLILMLAWFGSQGCRRRSCETARLRGCETARCGAARLRRCFLTASLLFPKCFLIVSLLFPYCVLTVSWLLPYSFLTASSLLPYCFVLFPYRFLIVSCLFP